MQQNAALGFRWLSDAHDSAQSNLKGATLFGLPVYQTVVQFSEEKPKQVTTLFFDRGDAGDLIRPEYEALLRKVIDAVSVATQAKYTVRGKDPFNAVKAEGLVWSTSMATYLLEYSFTKENKGMGVPFRAEFVRLQIKPLEQPKGLLGQAQSTGISKKTVHFHGPDHIATDEKTRDIAIKDVPMVDQGEKGYCVVAAAERVLRYYGIRVDANELAQLANTSSSGGTDVTAMTESLKKLTARLKIRVRTVEETNVHSIQTLISDYNRVAKLKKANTVPDPGHAIDIAAVYGQMDPDLLRELRGKNKNAVATFERKIKAHVDKGIPILWSVMLGVVPEPHVDVKKPAGHMRLITGYNEKAKMIVYSDTWGVEKEPKRMALADAWTISLGMSTIEPF